MLKLHAKALGNDASSIRSNQRVADEALARCPIQFAACADSTNGDGRGASETAGSATSSITRSQRLTAIAQSGLTYARDPSDIERHEAMRVLAAAIVAGSTGGDCVDITAFFARESGYATPKIDVRGGVFRDGELLLVRERSDGGWTLPGGRADVLDTPRTAVERKIREASGHLRPPQALHVWKIFVACDVSGGAPAGSSETDGVAFLRRDALPALSATRVTPQQLALMFAHHGVPRRPPGFDEIEIGSIEAGCRRRVVSPARSRRVPA